MPIQLNPFRPAYQNLLVPLAKNLVQPYTNIINDSVIPLYNSVRTNQSYEEGVEMFNSMLKTLELIVQISVYFFIYQKSWDIGMQYFGLALGPVVGGILCAAVYGAGCALDHQLNTRINDICTGSWLYYKGITTLVRSLGTNREGALAALLVGGFLGRKDRNTSDNGWAAKRWWAAEQLAWCCGYKKSIPINSSVKEQEPVPQ